MDQVERAVGRRRSRVSVSDYGSTADNRAGAPVGSIELPGNTGHRWMGAAGIYVVEREELDVPWLVRYRLGGDG